MLKDISDVRKSFSRFDSKICDTTTKCLTTQGSLSNLLILLNKAKSSYAFPLFSWILSFTSASDYQKPDYALNLTRIRVQYTQSILPENIVALRPIQLLHHCNAKSLNAKIKRSLKS